MFRALNQRFGLSWEVSYQGINVAEKASGVAGDVTVGIGSETVISAEITERRVDRSRVVSTIKAKIGPAAAKDYLFFIMVQPEKGAKEQAHRYFAQGHAISFVEIPVWTGMILATLGQKGRELFNKELLTMLESPDVPKSMKVGWNSCAKGVIGSDEISSCRVKLFVLRDFQNASHGNIVLLKNGGRKHFLEERQIVLNTSILKRSFLLTWTIGVFVACLGATNASADDPWISFAGGDGPGHGKRVVLVGGDEEYRSEECLPQLAKILSKSHGFQCTVVFAIDPATGDINPDVNNNIPGLEALKTADLMIIATRFRNLPDDQMQHVVDYVESGRPVIGMRTATHAFNIPGGKTFSKYSWNTDDKTYSQGFGRQVLGETWISHHGNHGSQSTRGIFAKGQESHPILKGIKDGEIWGPTDVYGVRPLPGDSLPLVLGQVVQGMKPNDPAVEGEKNSPMMPVAWTKSYKSNSGKTARVFTTTMGSSTDLENEGVRRMLVNATLWSVGLEDKITDKLNVSIIGDYKPSPFKFGGYVKGKKPADYAK